MERTELELTERARQGDKEAFNELLARQRDKAFSWANRIVSDPHLAEDVVQEALINAFLKLGTISDMTKFLPWLQKIVRNQAMMKLRRGGPYGKEQPFTSLQRTGHEEDIDWSHLDTVLFHYSKRASSSLHSAVPGHAFDLQLADTMSDFIRVLGPKEKQIFEKFFYEQLTPDEIAVAFDTNVNNVHKTISRIRKKLHEQKIEVDIRTQIRAYLDQTGYKKAMLPKPSFGDGPLIHPELSFPVSLYYALRSGGKPFSIAHVIGFSGYAFLLNLAPRIGPGGLEFFDWDTHITNGLLNMGFHSRYTDYQHFKHAPASKHKTEKFMFALNMIRQSVDRGIPALLSNGIQHEFSLIYGYDDQAQQLFAVDSMNTAEIPYSFLYTVGTKLDPTFELRVTRQLYAYVIDTELETHEPVLAVKRLVERIIRHADGLDPTFLPCINGIAAYDAWMEAFRTGAIDPLGNASSLFVYGWLRKQAADFWLELSAVWQSDERFAGYERWFETFQGAGQHYQQIAVLYKQLGEVFPFPNGGDPYEPSTAAAAVELLRKIKEAEINAVALLRSSIIMQEQQPIVHIPSSPFYSFGGYRAKPKQLVPERPTLLAVLVLCSDLKASLQFYSRLLGMPLHPEMVDSPVGVFPLQDGRSIVLMDRRLSLVHIDWRPVLAIAVPDIRLTFAELKRQNWEVVYALDEGGVQMDFFIVADKDGHQLFVCSSSFKMSSAAGLNPYHPIKPQLHRTCLHVKDKWAALQTYTQAFGASAVGEVMQFESKFHRKEAQSRIQLLTDQFDQAYRELRETGMTFVRYPGELDDGTEGMIVADPDGYLITIRVER
ncbi:sigma-70 family RNA polymerase sigma factor [Paenibacillus sp. PR3]|uniref:RNA polymerase sigma factor n=1 Tax=Paenibacillus terricola TaxID=2763503 RepID=A0ABR8MZI4_9BACL|nr:sigma-70 family RNA polymerase sigma factor [Paenibacillus terricola]MBD3920355.1 sigma-70 family RNA polymerase sigma factor [Paenibacillus terricola]